MASSIKRPTTQQKVASSQQPPHPSRRGRQPRHSNLHTQMLNIGIPLLVVLVAVIALGVYYLRFGSGSPDSGSATSQTSGLGTSSTTAMQLAPDFNLPTLGGKTFQLAAQRGHPVVLYFMATTCASCIQGSQELAQAIQAAHVAGARVLAIDVNPGDHLTDLQAFAQSVGQPAEKTLQWGIDSHDTIATTYGVQTLETTMVINAQGQIIARNDSPFPSTQLIQLLHSAA